MTHNFNQKVADICIDMAKDLHEFSTGRRPNEDEMAKIAIYLFNCLMHGALAEFMSGFASYNQDEVIEGIIEKLNDIMTEAEVDYPAGDRAGHRIIFDEAQVSELLREYV